MKSYPSPLIHIIFQMFTSSTSLWHLKSPIKISPRKYPEIESICAAMAQSLPRVYTMVRIVFCFILFSLCSSYLRNKQCYFPPSIRFRKHRKPPNQVEGQSEKASDPMIEREPPLLRLKSTRDCAFKSDFLVRPRDFRLQLPGDHIK